MQQTSQGSVQPDHSYLPAMPQRRDLPIRKSVPPGRLNLPSYRRDVRNSWSYQIGCWRGSVFRDFVFNPQHRLPLVLLTSDIMGFIKGTINVISNVATLGGAYRLEEAKAAYQMRYSEHEKLCTETRRFKKEIDTSVCAIGASLTAIRPLLMKCGKVLKTTAYNTNSINFTYTVKTLSSVEKFHSDFNAAIGIGAGTAAGGSLAVGSWALVGALGSAGTGAAISGLSGAAATNATLAWLGGGTLAAGGAGVSGGMAVLGGIVAVPLIAIASYSTHKKANETQEETVKLDRVIAEQKKHLLALPDVLQTIRQKKLEITRSCDDFSTAATGLIKVIRPFGVLSLLKQKILKLLRREPLTPSQTEAFDQLSRQVADFVCTFQRSAGQTDHEQGPVRLT